MRVIINGSLGPGVSAKDIALTVIGTIGRGRSNRSYDRV